MLRVQVVNWDRTYTILTENTMYLSKFVAVNCRHNDFLSQCCCRWLSVWWSDSKAEMQFWDAQQEKFLRVSQMVIRSYWIKSYNRSLVNSRLWSAKTINGIWTCEVNDLNSDFTKSSQEVCCIIILMRNRCKNGYALEVKPDSVRRKESNVIDILVEYWVVMPKTQSSLVDGIRAAFTWLSRHDNPISFVNSQNCLFVMANSLSYAAQQP